MLSLMPAGLQIEARGVVPRAAGATTGGSDARRHFCRPSVARQAPTWCRRQSPGQKKRLCHLSKQSRKCCGCGVEAVSRSNPSTKNSLLRHHDPLTSACSAPHRKEVLKCKCAAPASIEAETFQTFFHNNNCIIA